MTPARIKNGTGEWEAANERSESFHNKAHYRTIVLFWQGINGQEKATGKSAVIVFTVFLDLSRLRKLALQLPLGLIAEGPNLAPFDLDGPRAITLQHQDGEDQPVIADHGRIVENAPVSGNYVNFRSDFLGHENPHSGRLS
jgi:hypothetical protein